MSFVAAADKGGEDIGGIRAPLVLVDLLRYGAASVVALASDYGTLLALVHLGAHYLVASMVAFPSAWSSPTR